MWQDAAPPQYQRCPYPTRKPGDAMFATSATTPDHRGTSADAGQCWQVAVADSVAAFSVRELGLLRVRGMIPIVDGTVELADAGNIAALTATLDPAGIATGNSRRDADLRGP